MASPNLSLYDLRASVYERLDKLDRGLVDSKFMLQLDDKDARVCYSSFPVNVQQLTR